MRQSQQGASYIAILIAVVGFALLAKIAIAVSGPYLDDRTINQQVIELMQNSPKDITPSHFESQMAQRLLINNVSKIKFDDIATVKNDKGLIVKKAYEVRKPFLLNIDLVLKFEKNFDQSSVQAK
jgi:uncharacterized protein (UPF0248 family)